LNSLFFLRACLFFPRDFIFIEHLPRNPTGKVLKRELRTYIASPAP
jgi:acyl-coenzyme A synthetase/AMP-(fatty) acid ligase